MSSPEFQTYLAWSWHTPVTVEATPPEIVQPLFLDILTLNKYLG